MAIIRPAILVGSLTALAFVVAPADAQQQKYSTWSPPGGATTGQSDRLQEFVDRLNTMIDEAEKARAADPRFLGDLRELARGFDRPWHKLLLSDDFEDGDFTANPVWTVSAGKYWVEHGWGLRSAVTAAAEPADETNKKLKGRDAAVAILGAILNQATGQQGGTATGATAEPSLAAIHTATPVTNAFAAEIELSSWQGQGRLEFGPYQGARFDSGYRLVYTPGGPLQLLRLSPGGNAVVERSPQAFSLEDKKTHLVAWTRRADGAMTVAVDGKEVFAVTDRSFRDPFDGFLVVNRGGDYIVRRVAVLGTE